MPFVWEQRVRFVDTDASRRIHYTAMLRHFEAAEFEFLRSIDAPYASMNSVSFPRVRVECDYKSMVTVDDLLTITVTVERLGSTSFTLHFAARHGERDAATGKITIVSVSRETGRPTPIPEEFRAKLAATMV